jgi:hypothetical protein
VPNLNSLIPDGRNEVKAAAGEIIWREPVTHAVKNIGAAEAHAIAIDLKPLGRQKAP